MAMAEAGDRAVMIDPNNKAIPSGHKSPQITQHACVRKSIYKSDDTRFHHSVDNSCNESKCDYANANHSKNNEFEKLS
jgi:hypothetical protein